MFVFSACVLVPSGTAATASGAVRKVVFPAASYRGIDCGDFDGRRCIEALRKALIAENGASAAENINTSPVIFTRRILDPANLTAIPAAFAEATDRATVSGLTISGSGTPGDLSDPNPKPRPLWVTPQTALEVGGIPVAKNLFAAMKKP